MSNPWFTFGIVRDRWRMKNIPLPFEFGPGVRLMEIPDWIHTPAVHDPLRAQVMESLDHEKLCISVDYVADALGTPDPSWKGQYPQDMQTSATDHIFSVALALWLTKRVSVGCDLVVDCNNTSGEWVTRRKGEHDAMLTMQHFDLEEFTVGDFEQAKVLYLAMVLVNPEGVVGIAVTCMMRALTEQTFPLRHILLWIAMEGLFGPDDAGEITYRLSIRVALFLESRTEAARAMFRQIKESYRWRSKFVHGLRVKQVKNGEAHRLLSELEDAAARSLLKILGSKDLCDKFDSKRREDFLDEMVFEDVEKRLIS